MSFINPIKGLAGSIEFNDRNHAPSELEIAGIFYKNKFNFDFVNRATSKRGEVKCFVYDEVKICGHVINSRSKIEQRIDGSIFYNKKGSVIIGQWLIDEQPLSFIAKLNYVTYLPDLKTKKSLIPKMGKVKAANI